LSETSVNFFGKHAGDAYSLLLKKAILLSFSLIFLPCSKKQIYRQACSKK